MECTQRLEFENSQSERICPEQIGFLGILGTKYPVKKGPNKIGRDPKTCGIVLNLNSISRQHAVINVLNGRDIMLMDLDSANKTRLNNKSLQAYIPVALSNCDTVQFGEVFGVFRLLDDDDDLPSTQAVDVPDTPCEPKHSTRFARAIVPESPDVSDKDDSFIVPSQPKAGLRFKSQTNNFIKPSKTIAIQPVGTNKIDNIFWSSSKKSNSFNLDDSTNSLNESSQNGDLNEKEKHKPDESTDSIYTAETQLPTVCAPSIHSQDTQLPAPDFTDNKENCSIFNADTQLPTEKDYIFAKTKEHDIFNADTQLPNQNIKDESIYEANTQLPFDEPIAADNDSIFEAETQLPPNNHASANKNCKSIHEMDTQEPFPACNESKDSIYVAETQLPPVNASPSIYSQETQLPNLNVFEVRDSPKSIYDAKTQLPFKEPNVSTKKDDDIFDAETQLPAIEKEIDSVSITNKSDNDSNTLLAPGKHNVSTESKNTSCKDKSKDKFDKSDEIILFDEVETQNVLDDFNASQPLIADVLPLQEESEDIPLSQSDTITDDDFEIKLDENKTESKPSKRNSRTNSNNSTDCEDIDFLPTQKIPEIPGNEEELTDCEDETDGKKCDKSEPLSNIKSNFEDLATQVIPAAMPASESHVNFEDLATQVIPQVNVDNVDKSNSNPAPNPKKEPTFEDMPTQVIPEENCDKETNFEELQTQVIPENVPSTSTGGRLQFSEEVVASPFKIPLPTPIKTKRKEISKISDPKNTKSPLVTTNSDKDDNDKYYAATQELFEDLCSQKDQILDSRTVNNNVLKSKSVLQQEKETESISVEDYKSGTKFQNFEGEIEISVEKFARDSSSASSDGEENINKFVKSLSVKQISDVIGTEVTKPKRVPSDPSDVEVTPKKVRPFKFMETLLPDSQEIKTSVSFGSKTMVTESSSESEPEKESQEQTPIVFRKKKRVKADVKKDLTTKFDVQALPTRIITRQRKPTSKIQESDAATKKRSRNILKPKFLNDTEQDDEMDTEIISENITRLKNKNDKKNHKDTSGDILKIEEVKTENKRSSNEENLDTSKNKSSDTSRNKSKNNSKDTVDLTILDEEKPTTRSKNEKSNRSKNEKTNTGKDIIVNNKKHEEDKHKIIKTESDTSKVKPNETRQGGRSKKKDVQDKITNYTVSTDDSRISHSASKVDDSLNTAENNSQSTRSTRRNKDKEIGDSEKSASIEPETKRKRGRPRKEDKEKDNKDTSKDKITKQKEKKEDSKDKKTRKKDDTQDKIEQQEIRRSKRQKTTKEQNESKDRRHEQSTVYNVSSESSDSPKRKRLNVDTDAPSPKRTRSMTGAIEISSDTTSVASTLNSNSSSLRSTQSCVVKTHYVLFTAFPCEQVKEKLEKLGAVIVSDVSACSVVLTLQLRRTFKLLCAVGLGRPIVGPAWVQACVDNNTLVDPWQYLLQDAASEARFRFSLGRTLRGARGYLRGRRVSATPAVLPSAPEMKLIVECSGGVWVGSDCAAGGVGGAEGGRWLAVSCAADRALHAGLRARGATLVTSELILTGVLRQQLDIDAYRIH